MKMKNKSHKCEKCGHNFTFAWNLKQHLKHSKYCGTSDEEFKCANCGKKFTLSATMKQHFARCIAVDPYRFACTHCPRKFTFKSSLRKHLRGRCPNINYDSTQETNRDELKFLILEEVEEVFIDDIEFSSPDVKKESDIKRELDKEVEEFIACDAAVDNIELTIDQGFEYKFIYVGNHCSDNVDVVQN